KALALPPGLAFAVASDAFLSQARSTTGRGLYFDLVEFEAFAKKDQTPNTPAISLLFALEAQVAAIAAEGIEARWARHAAMAARVRQWAAGHEGYGILAPAGSRADTVTAVTVPDGRSGKVIADLVEKQGYVIGAGYGKLKDRSFRIGHMGDHTVRGLDRCLAAIDRVLAAG
ncbi:MAG TPA: hypothetical protein VG712_01170, partial [Gemmatimonadales bacterium]|nr:hypothetical protein [Gemmatimonadales bacterium]